MPAIFPLTGFNSSMFFHPVIIRRNLNQRERKNMVINKTTVDSLYVSFRMVFNQGMEGVTPIYPQLATTIPSTTREENYRWMSQFPSLREWVGERVINSMSVYGYALTNRKYESTIEISRDDIADDRLGLYPQIVNEMGAAAAQHPDQLLAELLQAGFTSTCYDGQYFFDEEHPVTVGANETLVSNCQKADEPKDVKPAWYLIDNSRTIKPFIWQLREKYELNRVNDPGDYNVFMTENFLYGVRGRGNMGYSFWQLAFASQLELSKDNFSDLYTRMKSQKSDTGRPLAITPKILLVGESNREAAFYIAKAETLDNLKPNPNYGLVDVIVSPYLD
ncbi:MULTISPECIES: Mu-like prophage major head subunit gpT family protein [Serratia]|uniref:Mu-like prophage major head subunit gpT family protein n=1 Tax=Serratia TaxID=613 RepID=UPI0019555651|nr:Mu-like prophage major head subunit gpT family protein [Serratia sp. 506_PEND]